MRYGSAFVSMVHNLMSALLETNLVHVEVHFGESPSPRLFSELDAAIGRSAHISFLDSEVFVHKFVQMYAPPTAARWFAPRNPDSWSMT